MASENTIYFYPGQGGHSHDGENSSFIDTSKYSLFDFSWGFLGDPDRRSSQETNYNSFQNFIVETVNNAVLKPAGLILQAGTVNGDSDIIANSITTKLIAANAITTNEISANAITANQIAANTITANQIAANTITANQIVTNTITANQIAANTITASEITSNTITANQIAANTITASEIASNTITANQIAANTITASEIASNTITANQIAAGAITADEIASNTITAGQIASNTITANQIAAGAITADELAANIVLVNNVIASTNYSPGVSGWAILGNGTAEFSSASIRGAIDADSVTTPGVDIDSAGNLTAPNFALYANGAIYGSGGNFQVNTSGALTATGATISGVLDAGVGSRIANFYFNGYGFTNGASAGVLGEINLDAFNNIVYAPTFMASDGQQHTEIKKGYMQLNRWGNAGPAPIRINRERGSFGNQRYIAFALAGYEGDVIGSINQTSNSSINYLTTSDSRLKTIVDKPYNALVVINTLMPRLYKWSLDDESEEHLGFFAQELYDVYPDAVGVGIDASEQDIDLVKKDPWGVDYSTITPLLTKAIQELCVKVEVLEQKVVELESS